MSALRNALGATVMSLQQVSAYDTTTQRKMVADAIMLVEKAKVVDVLNEVMPQIEQFVESKLAGPAAAAVSTAPEVSMSSDIPALTAATVAAGIPLQQNGV